MLYPIELRARVAIVYPHEGKEDRMLGMETLYLASTARLELLGETLLTALKGKGYEATPLKGEPKDGSLILLLLDMETTEEELYEDLPWLKEQFEYSSYKALRLMPFLFYHSNLGDIEEQFEKYLSDTVEEVLSGEFKPYGYDLDDEDPLKEFPSVLSSYEE